jgi:DNA-binding transcriptional LysR family regulator
MELRQLRYFVAVAEELHFRRAAARLHMSQPPLSNQLRMLEEELGCPLMIRSRRRVELTPAGEAFLRDARTVLGELGEAVQTARRIHAGRAGRLRISFVGSALLSLVPDVVKRYRAARPDVELQLRERSTEDQLRDLRAGAIDVGLLPLPVDAPDLRAEVLLRERAVAALPAAHPLAALKRVPLRRLAAEPLVLFPRAQAPGLHDRLLSSLTGPDGPPIVAQSAPETQTIVGLVAAEIGVSLVQASVQRLAIPGVTYRPVVGAPTIELAALLRPGEESRPARDFINLARAGTVPAAG